MLFVANKNFKDVHYFFPEVSMKRLEYFIHDLNLEFYQRSTGHGLAYSYGRRICAYVDMLAVYPERFMHKGYEPRRYTEEPRRTFFGEKPRQQRLEDLTPYTRFPDFCREVKKL